ncbi:unnamed protein product [Blepharisma stoltei]|uniref:PA domain-containing protein n=1 Tax=Blepharisma stoltei TaxID=1481888 RepID=A0AAU9IND1_9CILI|nr:unnamed protein product [Blepharisma stoltei]
MLEIIFVLISVVSSKILINSPDDLRREFQEKYPKDPIPSSRANFGLPPIGSLITGRVFIPKSDSEKRGCGPLSPISWIDPDPSHTPILLLERGGCSFISKVRNAQNIGASAVLVFDNVDEDVTKHAIIDDGTGANIYIPSLLISKEDGEIIKRKIVENHGKNSNANYVSITISFEVLNPDDLVEYEIWMSSENDVVRSFLHDFAPYAKRFDEDMVQFTPHYVLWHCSVCKVHNWTDDNPDCVSGGRYCAPDPDYDGPRNGREIVMEDLRQICINKIAQQDKNQKLWWNYIKAFNETCSNNNFAKRCSEQAMKIAKIDPDDVDECVENSFEKNNKTLDNEILKNEKEKFARAGFFFYPTVVINNQTYKGDLKPEFIMTTLCEGFKDEPKVCKDFRQGNKTDNNNSQGTGIRVSTLILIVLFSAVVLGVILFFYRRWIRSELNYEMKMQVNSAVNQYIALSERNNPRN